MKPTRAGFPPEKVKYCPGVLMVRPIDWKRDDLERELESEAEEAELGAGRDEDVLRYVARTCARRHCHRSRICQQPIKCHDSYVRNEAVAAAKAAKAATAKSRKRKPVDDDDDADDA